MEKKPILDPPANYTGRILFGEYTGSLKKRVRTIIASSENLEGCGLPIMPYLAAWTDTENIIWYEHTARQFINLLGCNSVNISRVFRDAILDRRIYRYDDQAREEIKEEILTRRQLSGQRAGLREEVARKGEVEAIYQVGLPDGGIIWLKDQAKIEHYDLDGISLSLGCLTDVTKEMEQKDLLERIGYFDELTGLPKRRIMERILEMKIGERNRGHILDFSVLMIDIDFFKSVNDTYGHQAGDSVLQELAAIMIATKRKEDEIGRYGGEEFYGVCQGDLISGAEFAERLRKKVADHPFRYQNRDIPVTVSIGVTSSHEFAAPSIEELVKTADMRLYQAKQGGRNRVVGLLA